MAETLKIFEENDDILASETNGNNQYLLSKVTDMSAVVQNYVEGEIATIKTNLATIQATLQNNINSLITKYESGANGYILFANGYCEQWGRVSISQDSTKTISLIKKYKNANYNVTPIILAGLEGLGRGTLTVSNFTVSTFNINNGLDVSGTVLWCARGFVS